MGLTRQLIRHLNRMCPAARRAKLGTLIDEAGIIDAHELADEAVTTRTIAPAAVTEEKLAADVRAPIWPGSEVSAGESFNQGRFIRAVPGGTVQNGEDGESVIGVGAADADPGDPGLVHVAGVAMAVAQAPLEAGDPLKAGTDGKVVTMCTNGNKVIVTGTGANFPAQPAEGTVQVVSADGADVSQSITIFGTAADDSFLKETLELDGDTPVTGSAVFKNVAGAILSAECAGTVTLKVTSGGATICTITAGNLEAGVLRPTTKGQAFNQELAINTADTEQVVILGVDPDGEPIEEALTGTSGSDKTAETYATVEALMVGDCAAATRTLQGDPDDAFLLGGFAIWDADEADAAVPVRLMSAIALA